jgi:hypothetical protein
MPATLIGPNSQWQLTVWASPRSHRLGVHVQQSPGAGPLGAHDCLTRSARMARGSAPAQRPMDGRVWEVDLWGDQTRAPVRGLAHIADAVVVELGQHSWAALGGGGAILEASDAFCSLAPPTSCPG